MSEAPTKIESDMAGRTIKIENDETTESGATSCATQNTIEDAPAEETPEINEEQLIPLNPEQTSKLKFPVGCPVLYNFKCRPPREFHARLGVVQSVGLALSLGVNTAPRFLYKVQCSRREKLSSSSSAALVFENDLAYAPNCPVKIKLNEDDEKCSGRILCCSEESKMVNGTNTICYTVCVYLGGNDIKIRHGVDGDKVEYLQSNDSDSKSKSGITVASRKNNQSPEQADVEKDEKKLPSSETVTASLDKVKNRDVGSNKSSTLVRNEKEKETVAKQTEAETSKWCKMVIPSWAQEICSQICNTNMDFIELNTGCKVNIHNSNENADSEQMHISIAKGKIHTAMDMVCLSMMDFFKDMASKARLVYDLKMACTGNVSFANVRTRNNIVRQRGLVSKNEFLWMKIVQIDGRDISVEESVVENACSKIREETSCSIEIVPDSPNDLQLRTPFALLYAKLAKQVSEGERMLADALGLPTQSKISQKESKGTKAENEKNPQNGNSKLDDELIQNDTSTPKSALGKRKSASKCESRPDKTVKH